MQLEFYPVEKLKKEIMEIISEYLNPRSYRVFFFGSRVKGDNFPRADIDIGIEGQQEIPIAAKLSIEEKIDSLPTLYKFDIIDFKRVSESFKKEALKNIEYVN
ncbi:MAG: nucleotidyltransferase domain-containing protein [Patescibacteria group bacterium]